MKLTAAFLLLFPLLFGSCSPDVSEERYLIPADFAGMIHSGYSNNPDREYALLNEMGVTWVQQDFSWSSIEPADDDWHFDRYDTYVQRANAEGKKVLGMLLYEAPWLSSEMSDPTGTYVAPDEIVYYCDYVKETVKRYDGKSGSAGRVDAWCIWNEPNLADRFWTGTKEEFFALTAAAAVAIREVNPDVIIVGGVLNTLADAGWIDGLFTSGAMDNVDMVAYHPYMPNAQASANIYTSFKNKVAQYGFADKIWVNEIGYPTQGSYGTEVAEDDMPDMVTKTITLLASGGAQTVFWYQLFDSATRDPVDSEDWFGLVWRKSNEEWIKKGGADAYALFAKNIPGKTYIPERFSNLNVEKMIRSYYFEGDDGSAVLIIWNEHVRKDQTIKATLPGTKHKLWNTATGLSEDISPAVDRTLYSLNNPGQSLLFLTWEK